MTIVTPFGGETRVNTATFGNQAQARGTALANGQYVVVWVDYLAPGPLTPANTANADIKARLFNADGTPAGAEFTVNSTTTDGQIFPNAITLSDGNFLVTWNNNAGTAIGGIGTPIATARGQEYTAAGVAVGGEFVIGTPGVETLLVASSGLAGGGFVSTWQQGGPNGAVVAQIYDSSNVAVGSQIIVDSTNIPAVSTQAVRTLSNGNFVIAWSDNMGATTALQIYTPTGVPVGPRIDSTAGGNLSSLAAITTGGFVIGTIARVGPDAFLGLRAYDNDGADLGGTTVSQQPVGVNGINPQGLSLASLANGGLAATWVDNSPGDGSASSVRLTVYGPSGLPIDGAEGLPVNTNTAGAQVTPTLLTLSGGDVVVLWNDTSGTLADDPGTSVRQQLFDVSTVNRAPVAVDDIFTAAEVPEGFGVDYLTDNDIDLDADILTVTSIFNVTGGTVNFNFAGQFFNISRPPGSGGPIEFDYTISDGAGGTSTAHAVLLGSGNDMVTQRGLGTPIDFLANDFLPPRPGGYSIAFTVLTPGVGSIQPRLIDDMGVQKMSYLPVNVTGYFDLLVGQTREVQIRYDVLDSPQGFYSATVTVVLQGWTQVGGTGFDALAGGAEDDHLVGGAGAANELQGRGGNDFYTVSAIGDTIVEQLNEGTDTVRAQALSVFTLPDNVENLQAINATATFIGIGNALNNSITGTGFSDTLAGGAGNDRLQGLTGAANELIGGTGDDIYFVGVAGDTIVEFAGEGTDTVQTSLASYALRDHLENLTYSGGVSFQGLGNAADNVLTGGTVTASALVGLGGNDTYVIRNAGDSIVEAAGGGTDTVQTALSVYRLNAANVENLTYTGTGNFTGLGNAMDNVITGGAGADYLFAGAGLDTLVGGAGADVFLFDAAVNGIDAIADFTSGIDRLFFNRTVFTSSPIFTLAQGVAPVAATADSAFLYNSTTGLLSYDADGNGAGAAVAIASLTPGLVLTTADFVFYG